MIFKKRIKVELARVASVATAIVVMTDPVQFGATQASAQTSPRLVFEVASLRPNRSAASSVSLETIPVSGRFVAVNETVKDIIQFAYGLRDFQISGSPGWIDGDRYDIEAKAEKPSNDSDLRMMLQAFLADRFKLRIHHESRQLSVYELVVARSGQKLKPSTGTAEGVRSARGMISAQRLSMKTFAELFLSRELGRPVLDETGLEGYFDFKLQWTPDGNVPPGPKSLEPAPVNPELPSLFTGVEEQLGLRLQAANGSVDVILIDHIEKPSER